MIFVSSFPVSIYQMILRSPVLSSFSSFQQNGILFCSSAYADAAAADAAVCVRIAYISSVDSVLPFFPHPK